MKPLFLCFCVKMKFLLVLPLTPDDYASFQQSSC